MKPSLKTRTVLLILATIVTLSCQSNDTNPQPSNPPQVVATFLTAELVGTLTKGEGCIRVNTVNESFGIVFPPDASMTELENSVTVVTGVAINNLHEVNIAFGERVTVSGGELETLTAALEERVNPSCKAPYWVMGETIRLSDNR